MLPAICLPAGRNADGLPMGLQVTGSIGDDEELLLFAIDLERVVWS
jgi:Asp-tRNA(Asn)/Glu-tRNA(Gln) amidotransferase A subunit family amidase